MKTIIENREEFEKEMRAYYSSEEYSRKEYVILKSYVRGLCILTNETWRFVLFSLPSLVVLVYFMLAGYSTFATVVFMITIVLIYRFFYLPFFCKNHKKEHEEYCYILKVMKDIESKK